MTATAARRSAFVTPTWLLKHLDDPTVRIVDASFKLPGTIPKASDDYAREHIAGAVFFDIDDVAAPDSDPLPHMLPSPELFAEKVGKLGIGDGDTVVLYDVAGIAGPARVWWTFRVFGHDSVFILEGGLRAWKELGLPADDVTPSPEPRHLTPRFRPELVHDKSQVLANIQTRDEQLIDARSAGRFAGTAPEFWLGRRQGHIPGSLNVDYSTLVDPTTGALKPPDELRQTFEQAGYDPGRPAVTSCGSGITASVLALALHEAGLPDAAVYDGSWAEWGLPGDLPIETGPPRRYWRGPQEPSQS
jgi:thiosulfate/3-mercaptopyruvate sulfurtransferase